MRRIELLEIHDHASTPLFLRHYVTDALQQLQQLGDSYGPIVPLLRNCLKTVGSSSVLDLCSGGGGPWLKLYGRLTGDRDLPAEVTLSDKYPNLIAFRDIQVRSGFAIHHHAVSVDAANVPADLGGFRTMFSTFHHFAPHDARQILRDALRSGDGIGIFEIARRNFKTLLVLSLTPFLVLWITPRIRPFRWSRLFWTYLVPLVPLIVGIDGVLSCLRAYSMPELQEMARELEADTSPETFHWEVGETHGGLLGVTYLVCSISS